MRTLKITLAYDGTNYVGWQRQANGVSIQGLAEDAFAPLTGAAPGPVMHGAGRTDAGVHALAQVASVSADITIAADAVQRAMNVRLPADVRVVAVEEATPGFHARFDAVAKTYRYRIATAPVLSPFDRWFAWHSPVARDVDAMRRAAAVLVGRHDFVSFQARGSSVNGTERTLHRVDVLEQPGAILVEIEADGFLRHMVRAIVGTLADIGAGVRPVTHMADALAARHRSAAGPTAPASGLTLVGIRYD